MPHSDRFVDLVNSAKKKISEITPEEVFDKLKREDDCLLIDVREEHEWDLGRVMGAIHVGKGVIERDIEKHVENLDREIILYCGGGFRSALAAEALQQMGFTNVSSLAEGWRGWLKRGYPTNKFSETSL